MTKLGFFVAAILAFAPAFAAEPFGPFYDVPQAQVSAFVSPLGAQAVACNTAYSFPLDCAVLVRGFYPDGIYKFATVELLLPPGGCDTAFVAPDLAPFAYADATAQCLLLEY